MKKVAYIVSAHALSALLRIGCAWLAPLSLLLSCSTVHVEPGTETGNPPVLDADKLVLLVASDSVRIVGSAGAVSPGGVSVEATIVGTGEVERSMAKADGSFEIPLNTSADVVVELRARAGDASSRAAYVTRGGALVSGDGAALSCMQRGNLASQATGSLASAADTSCASVADCTLISNKTVCTDSCGELPIATRAVASLRAGIAAIERDLCASFASDGCNVLALPCPPPPQGLLACVEGQCILDQSAQCPDCLNQTVSWGPSNGLTMNTISGCDGFVQKAGGSPICAATLLPCHGDGLATLEQLIVALAHSDVEAALASGGIVGGPTAPGGFSTNVKVDERSFTIANCGTGANCSPIPAGVSELRDLLDRLADQTCGPAN